jgi:hypothetical protein
LIGQLGRGRVERLYAQQQRVAHRHDRRRMARGGFVDGHFERAGGADDVIVGRGERDIDGFARPAAGVVVRLHEDAGTELARD